MNKHLLLGLALFTAMEASAQNFFQLPAAKNEQAALFRKIISGQAGNSAAQRPTTIQQRVIGMAVQGSDADSVGYTYSGTNGSTYNYNSLSFTFATQFDIVYPPHPLLPMIEHSDMMKADSILSFDNSGLYYIEAASYNSINKIDTIVSREADVNQGWMTTAEYDAGGAPYQVDYFDLDEMGSTPTQRTLHVYNDTDTRLLSDSLYDWDGTEWLLSQYVVYNYNSDGKVAEMIHYIPGVADPFYSIVVNWNSDGLIENLSQYEGSIENGIVQLTDTVTYFPGTNMYKSYIEYYLFGEDEYITQFTRSLNADNLPDSIMLATFQSGFGWEETGVILANYNDYNNPVSLTLIPAIPEDEVTSVLFYYEEYDDASTVQELNSAKQLLVYPNPFVNQISFEWQESGSVASLSITDMLGRCVFQQELPAQTGVQTVNVPEIATGNYLLQITDDQGHRYQSKLTKK